MQIEEVPQIHPPQPKGDELYDKLVAYMSELKNESSYWKGYLNGYRNGS
jgi:hypothetical protein